MNNKELALLVANTLDNKKAQDVMIIDIKDKSGFADYFVIASGTSERQVASLTDEVEDALAKEGVLVKSIEGRNGSTWMLLDFRDIIVNIFTEEERERYSIEKVWGDCEVVEFEPIEG